MGIANVTCCSKQNPIIKTECKIPEDNGQTLSLNDKQLTINPLLKKLTSCKSISSFFEFILSGDYYLILISQKSEFVLISHMLKMLNHNDILTLLVKMIDWIHICNSKNNVVIKKKKFVIKLVTKNLIKDIEKGKGSDDVKVNIAFGLYEVSKIAQYIKYSTEKGSTKYKVNYWGNKDVDECLRINLYNVIAYLVKGKEVNEERNGKGMKEGCNMKNTFESESTLGSFNINKQTEQYAKVINNFFVDITSNIPI